MQYTYKNAKFKVNGKELLANTLSIKASNSVAPVYEDNRRGTSDYSPVGFVNGETSLSYYLTGADPLKDFTNNPTGVISGHFGGLYFESGYLTSYATNFSPQSPIVINANIVFFDTIKGVFTPEYNNNQEFNLVNVSDVTITGCSIGNIDEISNIRYSFTNNISPQFLIGNTAPSKILFNASETAIDISTSFISGSVPYNGEAVELEITLSHPNLSSYSDSFFCFGRLTNRSIGTSVGGTINNTLSVRQDYGPKKPVITSITSQVGGGNIIRIRGLNMLNTQKVLFCINGETTPRGEAEILAKTSTTVDVIVPPQTSSGQVIII